MSRLWKWEAETPWPWIVGLAGAFMTATAFIGYGCAEPTTPEPQPFTPQTSGEPVVVPAP